MTIKGTREEIEKSGLDALFSESSRKGMDEVIKQELEIPKIPKGSSFNIIYWFQKDTHLLVKMEEFHSFPNVAEVYRVLTYHPSMNQKNR